MIKGNFMSQEKLHNNWTCPIEIHEVASQSITCEVKNTNYEEDPYHLKVYAFYYAQNTSQKLPFFSCFSNVCLCIVFVRKIKGEENKS